MEIAEAGTFTEVAELLERGNDVDLVLLDLTMPGVRGFSGLMYMRAQYPSVPVIVVSANDDPAAIRRCMAFGASRRRSVRRLRRRECRLDGAHGDADAAAGTRADDAVGGSAQQADRLSAWRLRGDGEGARFGDPAKTWGRKPHASRDRRCQDRKRPVVARRAGRGLIYCWQSNLAAAPVREIAVRFQLLSTRQYLNSVRNFLVCCSYCSTFTFLRRL